MVKMKCEYCNKEVEKGYMEDLETLNLRFYLCEDCMLIIEDKIEEMIKVGKDTSHKNCEQRQGILI